MVHDPRQGRQAHRLQVIILAIIAILLIATLSLVWAGNDVSSATRQFILGTNVTAAALMSIPWFLLRQGHYHAAVYTLIGLIFSGIETYLFVEGVSQYYFLLLFVIPITLSGLLLGRSALWLSIGLSVLLLAIPTLTITPPARPYNPASLLGGFTLVIVLQGILQDRLIAGLWEAIAEVSQHNHSLAEREREKQGMLAAAEQHLHEREQMETVLHQTQKLESLGVMAGGIAHDFNNLLSAVLGQASLAKMKLAPDDPAIPHINRSIAAAERAADLTRQLLIYSGRGQIERKPLSLNKVIQENLPLLKVAIPANVQLRYTLLPELPLIMADQGQMHQVVMNLLLNSAQAIGNKPGYVTITTSLQHLTDETEPGIWQYGGHIAEPGEYVLLEVTDSGSGIPPEVLPRIFEPFFTTKATGHGLGLAIVLGIVRTHQGHIQLESTPEEGTVFRLFFPATQQTAIEPEANLLVTDRPANATATGLVLIIDDEEAIVTTLTDILMLEGLSVLSAFDGKAGIQKYREYEQEINLIILDISMPGMDGIETLYRLQAINPEVRVIISSGLNKTGKLLPLTLGSNVSYLQKPYTVEKALAEITRRLAEPSSPRMPE